MPIKNLILLIVLICIAMQKSKASELLNYGVHKKYLATFNKVSKVNKSLSVIEASIIANSIIKIADKHKLNINLFSTILAQESRFKNAVRCRKGRCTDYGISQINIGTIKRYNFDAMRLLFDTEYAIEAGAIVLKDFKTRYYFVDNNWWTRYNTSNPIKRLEYASLVERFL